MIATLVAFTLLPHDAHGQATAVRAPRPPVLDGKADDPIWQTAPATRGFRQFEPGDDIAAQYETEFRVAYDDRNLYVIVRAEDPNARDLERLLSRRDVRTNSDQIKLIIDDFSIGGTPFN